MSKNYLISPAIYLSIQRCGCLLMESNAVYILDLQVAIKKMV
jgi:hypothetical protein